MDALTVWKLLNETIVKLKTIIETNTHAATSKTTPADADEFPGVDSADSYKLYKLTWANLVATLKTYFDGLYSVLAHTHAPSAPAAHDQNASTIIIPSGMGTPTSDDLQDYLNNAQSSGRIKVGTGVLTAHAGPDGTLDISEMEGMIHTANTQGSPLIYFKKAAYSGLALTDNAVNFIIITYTAPGGVPTLTYSTSASRPADNTYNAFVIGRCWRSGNDVEVITTGQNIYDMYGRAQDRLLTKYGTMDHASGAIIGAHATPLRLTCDAGIWYFGNTRIDTPKVGHVGDKFHVWYKTGGGAWTESAQLTLFSEVFDGGGGNKVYETYQNGTSLGTLTGAHYGVYWIYMCPEGDIYCVLGDASYSNIGNAQAATSPASLPPYLVNWGVRIGRIIIKKTAAAFYSVETEWSTKFTASGAVDHASLVNLAMADSGHPAATAAVNGYATATQITKLDGIAAGSQVNVLEGVTGTAPIVAGAVTAKSQAISISAATTGAAGSMSSADKTKLDGIAAGANAYVHPNHSGDVTSAADGAQTIGAKKVTVAMLADGTDGQLITWDAAGVAAVVAAGTATHVLTSNGAGAAPTFQAPTGGAGAIPILPNALINGGFDWFRRMVTPATPIAMTDDVYNAPDRFYSLVQGANATIGQAGAIGTSVNSCKLTAGGTTNRYGIAQIIESFNSIPLRSQTVIAQVRLKPVNNAASGTRKYRIAILEWTGTADTVTSELVADWTSGTFTTAGFFASTTKTLVGCATVTATHNVESVLSVTGAVSASCNNLIVFVWTEDAPTHASDYVLISEAGLYVASATQTWNPRPFTTELLLCQRYFLAYKSEGVSYGALAFGYWESTTVVYFVFEFPVKMRAFSAVTTNNVSNGCAWNTGAVATLTGINNSYGSSSRAILNCSVASGGTAGKGSMMSAISTNVFEIYFESEL